MTKEVIREQSGPSQCLQSYRVAVLRHKHEQRVHGYLRGSCAVTTPDSLPAPASVTVGAIFRARAPRLGAVLSGCKPPKRRSRRWNSPTALCRSRTVKAGQGVSVNSSSA